MTDKAFPREDFDREPAFVVQRPIMLSGKELAPGTVFDKSLVTGRKLRQLYDQRYLRFAEPEELTAAPRKEEPRAKVKPRGTAARV